FASLIITHTLPPHLTSEHPIPNEIYLVYLPKKPPTSHVTPTPNLSYYDVPQTNTGYNSFSQSLVQIAWYVQPHPQPIPLYLPSLNRARLIPHKTSSLFLCSLLLSPVLLELERTTT